MTDWNHSTPLATAGAFAQAMIPLRVEGSDPTNPALDTFEQVAVATVIAAAAGTGSGGGQPVSIDLFVSLSAHALPATVTAFIAGGHAIGGLGGGTYIADSLATGSLASRCPRFCAADSTGRLFRLMAVSGAIAISQGGALGGANNDQPAVQAAIDYAAAIKARTLLFDLETVSIWNTARTSNAGQGTTDAWAQDGQSLWVTAPIKFLGLPTRTHVKMLSVTGTSLETGWQNVGGNVWRGSGINLIGGSQTSPNANLLSFFAMENIWLDGGCTYTGVRTAVTPSSPDGPDLTNKGLRLQDTQCDAITLFNFIITGFKGEAYYCAGTVQCVQNLNNCAISGSNQSAFNPSIGPVYARNCTFGNSFIAMECLGRTGGSVTNTRFYNSSQAGVTGGPAGAVLYNYGFPTRDVTTQPPWFDVVDCEFMNIGQLSFANYVRVIRGRATDCALTLNTALTIGAFTSTYIDLDITIDQMNQNPLCAIQGPLTTTTVIPGATGANYIQPPSDVHIRLNIHRTANAIATGYFCVPFADSGLIDQNSCSYTIGDCDGVTSGRAPNYGGTNSLAMPLVVFEGPSNSQVIGSGTAFSAYPLPMTAGPYAATISNPRHLLQNSGAVAAIAVTVGAPFTAPGGYANGQRTRIFWGGTTGTTYTFARNGTGLRLNSNCVLAVAGDWIELEFTISTGLWHEIGRGVYAP